MEVGKVKLDLKLILLVIQKAHMGMRIAAVYEWASLSIPLELKVVSTVVNAVKADLIQESLQ